MSGSNLQTVRDLLDLWRQGALQRAGELIAPDAKIRPLRAQLERTSYSGPEGFRRMLAELALDWEDLDFDAEELHEEGENVVAIGRLTARARASGADVDTRIAWRWVVRDGLLLFGAAHSDPAHAIREAKLSGATLEAVAAVRRHYAAFNRDDVDEILATLHPEIEVFGGDERAGGAGERYRGLEEARTFFAEIKELVADNRVEVLSLEAVAGRVVASVRLHGTLRSNDALSGSVPAVHFLTIRDGLVARIETYRPNWRRADREAAARAGRW